MKTFLVLLALALVPITAHVACAAEEGPDTPSSTPTEPPPFTPGAPTQAQPGHDLDDLMKMLTGADSKEVELPECESHPCVQAYRFSDSVDDDSSEKFGKFMAAATKAKVDMVMVEINTPGGSMDDGHEISRLIEMAPFQVVCVVDGKAASMGMYLLESCDTRVMTKRSMLMIHQVSLNVGRGARLTETSLANATATIQVATRAYVEWVAHRMKVSAPQVLQLIHDGREWWLDWEAGIKAGAVDKVIATTPNEYLKQLKKTGKP